MPDTENNGLNNKAQTPHLVAPSSHHPITSDLPNSNLKSFHHHKQLPPGQMPPCALPAGSSAFESPAIPSHPSRFIILISQILPTPGLLRA